MVKQEGPVFCLSFFPPLLAEFHAFFSVEIIFGYEAAFHLLQLRCNIAAEKYFFAVLFNPANLVKFTVGAG
jgi:hypothetical protein